jgi:DNA-binding transcriptional MocR family regulator
MGTKVRVQLIDLAPEYDILIISDDVYDFLRWPEEPTSESTKLTPIPPRLSDVDRLLAQTINGEMPSVTARFPRSWLQASGLDGRKGHQSRSLD